jgi:uncharacterized UBP type Zn finger protein
MIEQAIVLGKSQKKTVFEALDQESINIMNTLNNLNILQNKLENLRINDQKSLEDFYRKMNENNDNEDDDNNIIENDEEKEIEEEKSKDEKKKVVYRRIKKRSFIDEAPKILVLNLKRFINIDLYGHVRKSEKFVDFQPFLKLGPYLSPIRQDKDTQPFYRLYGVVVHSGFSIQSGHYFAYISRTIGDWFYASDVTIRPSSWDEVKKSRPYLLLY